MQKSKICHITSAHPPFDTRIFQKECMTLAEEGYDVTLIAQHDKNDIVNGIKIVALSKEKNRLHRMFGLTWKACKLALKQKSDIYHFHDPNLIPVGIILKVLGKKVIYDVHEDNSKAVMSKYYLPKYSRRIISFFMYNLENNAARLFDYIIAAGDDIAESVFSAHNHKLVTLKNVPPYEFIRACNRKEIKEEWIIYIGSLTKVRGIKEIVEAMNYVTHDVKLILIGSLDDNNFEKELLEIANEKVQFAGPIPYKKVPEFIRKAKVGLICFYPEPNHLGALSGRNNKLYEYMAGGLAIVASNFSEWTKVIEGHNIGITVDPKNPKSIASAIDYLLDNQDVLAQMGHNGINAVSEEFNWEFEKKKLLTVYSKLLK